MEQNTTTAGLHKETRRLTLAALMVGLSALGAFIKIPGPLGSIAMDSCPGYLYASLCGPAAGAAVAFVGHLASALTAGFPLGVPFHLLVAGEMALCASVYGAIGFSLEGFRDKKARTGNEGKQGADRGGNRKQPKTQVRALPWIVSGSVAFLLNGIGAPLVLAPWLGMGAVIPLIVPLLVASFLNVAVALLALKALDASGRLGSLRDLW
jgi:hypothetical protein